MHSTQQMGPLTSSEVNLPREQLISASARYKHCLHSGISWWSMRRHETIRNLYQNRCDSNLNVPVPLLGLGYISRGERDSPKSRGTRAYRVCGFDSRRLKARATSTETDVFGEGPSGLRSLLYASLAVTSDKRDCQEFLAIRSYTPHFQVAVTATTRSGTYQVPGK